MSNLKNLKVIKSVVSLRDIFRWLNIEVASNGSYRCPIHGQDKTASAVYYEDSDSAHCFGCAKSYDIFELVKDFFNITFYEAIQRIEERFGIDYTKPIEKKEKVFDDNKLKLSFMWQYDNRMGEYIFTNKIKNLDLLKEIWDSKKEIDINLEVTSLEILKEAYQSWYEKARGKCDETNINSTRDIGSTLSSV